jgi:integrase
MVAKSRRVPGEEYLVRRTGSATWHISFRIGSFRLRQSSGTQDRVAAAHLACQLWQREWTRIRMGVVVRDEMTLAAAFDRYYREAGAGTAWGEGGMKHILRVITETLGPRLNLSALDDAMVNNLVQAVRGRREEPASPATLNRYLAALSSVCKRARELWNVEVGGWSMGLHIQREATGREVFLEVDQAKRLLDAAVGHLRPVLLLALMTGMRRGNVLGLAWSEVSMDQARATVVQKGDRRLVVALPPEAVALLASIQPDPADRVGPVFTFGHPRIPCRCSTCLAPSKRGRPVTSVRRAFATAAAGAGVRDMPNGRLRFHDLRHTFASFMLAQGGDLKLVQEALGHAQITTTARYAHLLPGRKEAVIGQVAGLLG